MTKHSATAGRKKSLLTGRSLGQGGGGERDRINNDQTQMSEEEKELHGNRLLFFFRS